MFLNNQSNKLLKSLKTSGLNANNQVISKENVLSQLRGQRLLAENGWDLSEDEVEPEVTDEMVNLCLMELNDASTSEEQTSSSIQQVTSSYNILLDLHITDSEIIQIMELSYTELKKKFNLMKTEKKIFQERDISI